MHPLSHIDQAASSSREDEIAKLGKPARSPPCTFP